jgi:hypothetical protein
MNDFLKLLHADGPHPEHAEALSLYGRFVGNWDAEITAYGPDRATYAAPGAIHFGWVLEGRAVQDIWMAKPSTGARAVPVIGNLFGTTLRVYDPALAAWRISWFDPGRGVIRQQIGRRQGNDIVQEGTTETDELTRWSFVDITGDSFRWRGEVRSATSVDWQLTLDVRARRRPA